MKRPDILIDTNIFLDVFFEREEFYENSRTILTLCEERKINGFITASSITDIFYIIRKELHDNDSAYDCLGAVLDIVRIIPVTDSDILTAYSLKASDFEDCLVATCAKAFGCNAIITRNPKDFQGFGIKVMEPSLFIQQHLSSL